MSNSPLIILIVVLFLLFRRGGGYYLETPKRIVRCPRRIDGSLNCQEFRRVPGVTELLRLQLQEDFDQFIMDTAAGCIGSLQAGAASTAVFNEKVFPWMDLPVQLTR